MTTVNAKVAASADDADETGAGTGNITASTSNMRDDGGSSLKRYWGGRWALAIPQGATISSATLSMYVTANVDGILFDVTTQAADTCQAFDTGSTNKVNGSGRTWSGSPTTWTNASPTTSAYNTFDVTAMVQTIINRAGWVSGNYLGLRLDGDTPGGPINVTFQNYDGSSANAAKLDVVYTSGNVPPSVDAGVNQTIPFGVTCSLDGTVTDDGLPNPPAALTYKWTTNSYNGGAGASATFANDAAVDTTCTFPLPGVYELLLQAWDDYSGAPAVWQYDTVTITVLSPSLAMMGYQYLRTFHRRIRQIAGVRFR